MIHKAIQGTPYVAICGERDPMAKMRLSTSGISCPACIERLKGRNERNAKHRRLIALAKKRKAGA